MAVLPTPGSPIKQGLFLERLFNIWIILWISLSLPITVSNWLFLAFWVKLVPYVSKTFLFFDFLSTFTFFFSDPEDESSFDILLPSFIPNMLEKIDPNGIAPNCISGFSLFSESKLSSSLFRLSCKFSDISEKFMFSDISLNIDSNCFVILLISFSDKLACFIRWSIGLIPLFLAQS